MNLYITFWTKAKFGIAFIQILYYTSSANYRSKTIRTQENVALVTHMNGDIQQWLLHQ